MANSMKSAAFLIESRLAEAAKGDANAYFELGVIYSTGSEGVEVKINKANGFIEQYSLNGAELLKSPLTPNFWRPPTENGRRKSIHLIETDFHNWRTTAA